MITTKMTDIICAKGGTHERKERNEQTTIHLAQKDRSRWHGRGFPC